MAGQKRATGERVIGAVIAALFVCGFSTMAAPAHGQIVNVQSLVGRAVQDGWTGNAALSGDWLAGNSRLRAGSATATQYWRGGPWLGLLTVAGAYGIKGSATGWQETPFQQKIFEHGRLRRQLSDHLSAEAFVQHEYDRWRRLELRALVGGGLRWDGHPIDGLALAAGLSLMGQAEQLLSPKAGDPLGLVYELRLSSYLSGALELSKNAAVSATLYAQPQPMDPADIRGLVDVALQVAATPRWSLKLQHSLALDSRPPIGVEGYDATTKAALVAGW
jgi:hypothetical protein